MMKTGNIVQKECHLGKKLILGLFNWQRVLGLRISQHQAEMQAIQTSSPMQSEHKPSRFESMLRAIEGNPWFNNVASLVISNGLADRSKEIYYHHSSMAADLNMNA